jgi:hypothetical protein
MSYGPNVFRTDCACHNEVRFCHIGVLNGELAWVCLETLDEEREKAKAPHPE